MAKFDWDKWSLGWALGLPKGQMWAKIRTGKHDGQGNPIYQRPTGSDTATADPILADVLAAHRFVVPGSGAGDAEHCFCEWSGKSHAEHLAQKVGDFLNPQAGAPAEVKKAPAKKAPAKKAPAAKVGE